LDVFLRQCRFSIRRGSEQTVAGAALWRDHFELFGSFSFGLFSSV
jgi:hypothetical protein